eukprot:Nk52_evm5s2355 gene=Nk52_evmTU5s2355
MEVSGFRKIKDSLKQAYDRIISKLDAHFGTALRAPPNKIMIGDCVNLNNEGIPDEGQEDNTHYLHHFIVEKLDLDDDGEPSCVLKYLEPIVFEAYTNFDNLYLSSNIRERKRVVEV